MRSHILIALALTAAACGGSDNNSNNNSNNSSGGQQFAASLGVDLKSMKKTPSGAWYKDLAEGAPKGPGRPSPTAWPPDADLGHEEPTLLMTNQLAASPVKLVGRYAQRMLIENGIQDGVDFFHMDALSSAVAMKVNCDVQLTLMASSLYRLLGTRVGHGYDTAKSSHIFRDLIKATAHVTLGARDIAVHLHRRAHNPLLIAAGFPATDIPIPWLGGKHLRIEVGD